MKQSHGKIKHTAYNVNEASVSKSTWINLRSLSDF